jgi:hypothetical protein
MGLDQYFHVNVFADLSDLYTREVKDVNKRYADKGIDYVMKPGEEIYLNSYDFQPDEVKEKFRAVTELTGTSELVDPNTPSISLFPDRVVVTAAYWRKANAIHRWFVEKCQNGMDECQESDPISPEQLAKLVADCRGVLDNESRADDLLPTQSGFFFGGTSYDEWYKQDLEYTATRIEFIVQWCLMNLRDREFTFNYQSSW